MNRRTGVVLSPRHRRLLVAFISAVAVLGALTVAGWLAHWPSGVFGGSARSASAPAEAVTTVTDLTSRNPATLRRALAVNYPVKATDLAPAGTSIQVRPGSWRQQGDYATVQAVVKLPGRAPLGETIYFIRKGGRWLVLFADPS